VGVRSLSHSNERTPTHPKPTLLNLFLLALLLPGCGSTVLRDLGEEARQAEWAAIDSLPMAPGLMIADIEYEVIPPEPRRSSLDRRGNPGQIAFHVTASNVGDEDLLTSFVLAVTRDERRPSAFPSTESQIVNREDTVKADGGEVTANWYSDLTRAETHFKFRIITNPKIQRDIGEIKYRFVADQMNRKPAQITRELRYDNNELEITLPPLR
jgi:hypothetical protein